MKTKQLIIYLCLFLSFQSLAQVGVSGFGSYFVSTSSQSIYGKGIKVNLLLQENTSLFVKYNLMNEFREISVLKFANNSQQSFATSNKAIQYRNFNIGLQRSFVKKNQIDFYGIGDIGIVNVFTKNEVFQDLTLTTYIERENLISVGMGLGFSVKVVRNLFLFNETDLNVIINRDFDKIGILMFDLGLMIRIETQKSQVK